MKQKTVNKELLTEEKIKEILKDYPTSMAMDIKFDKQDRKFEERFVQFKSDIFTRFDEVMGELAQGREDRVFTDHDIKNLKDTSGDHEKRLQKLETS